MIGRRCKHSNVFSRPVLIARNLSGKPDFKPRDLSQEIYCGGYISVDPPLPIPNREVKHTGADGSAIPSVRVGSCRFSRPSSRQDPGVALFLLGLGRPKAPAPARSSMTLRCFFHFNIISDIPYRPFNRQTTVSTPRKVPDPGGPLMRTSIIGARPPQNPCALFVLYDFGLCAVHCGTISLTPVDSILSMKRADSVDKTARNGILSMKTHVFVDKVAAVVGVSLAWFRRSKFRLHPFTNSRTRAVR